VPKITLSFSLCASMFCAAFLMTACGGGGGDGSNGSGGLAANGSGGAAPATSSFTAGPITGFGSVVVRGTHFDISGASIFDDEDNPHRQEDLKLGMLAEIDGDEITVDAAGSHCHARDIHFRSGIIGPVDAIDTSTRLLVVLGQTIDVTDTTVFDERFANGAFSIHVGDVLEIFGTPDMTTGHFVATRIEPKADASFFKLRGVVTNLDNNRQTFVIGGQTISFANLSQNDFPNGLANGRLVTIRLQRTQVNGVWIAVSVRDAVHRIAEQSQVEIKGRVTSVSSPTQFSVEGIPVDARNARFDPNGATIAVRAEVEVKGRVSNGTIVASKVEFEDENEHRGKPGDDDNRRNRGRNEQGDDNGGNRNGNQAENEQGDDRGRNRNGGEG
jgi:hypothetical protein